MPYLNTCNSILMEMSSQDNVEKSIKPALMWWRSIPLKPWHATRESSYEMKRVHPISCKWVHKNKSDVEIRRPVAQG